MTGTSRRVRVLTEAEAEWLLPGMGRDGADDGTPLSPGVAPSRDGDVTQCVVSADGRRLLLDGGLHEREVLVALDVEETPGAVRLVARLGPDPAAVPPVRHQRDGYSFTVHFDIALFWRREVVLQRPLGTRSVRDVGSHQDPGR